MPSRPTPSSDHVRRRFEQQRTRDTTPELALRRRLHAMGLRYRVDQQVIPNLRRRADLVFVSARVAVFVDGCFWHQCPEHGNVPKSNREWWRVKLERNVERDRQTDEELDAAGWSVARVWEHELRDDPETAARRVADAVANARSKRGYT